MQQVLITEGKAIEVCDAGLQSLGAGKCECEDDEPGRLQDQYLAHRG